MFNDYAKTKTDLEELIKNYQAPIRTDLYTLKKLNENDEAENILINQDTIFLGTNRMQIKKLDGTLEKYNIERYYPVDERDLKIKELNQKVEELERKLNNEHTEHIKSNKECDKSNANDDGNVESNTKSTNE